MIHPRWFVGTLILAAAISGPKASGSGEQAAPPPYPVKREIERELRRLTEIYQADEKQKARLEAVLVEQLQANRKWTRENGMKLKDLGQQINRLNEEKKKLTSASAKLQADFAVKIEGLFSHEQKLLAKAKALQGRVASRYGRDLNEGRRARIAAAAMAAARKIADADPAKRDQVEREVTAELRRTVDEVVTPEIIRRMAVDDLARQVTSTVHRAALTDAQIGQVRALCEECVAESAKAQQELAEAERRVGELKARVASRGSVQQLRDAITAKILTPQQRKALGLANGKEPEKVGVKKRPK